MSGWRRGNNPHRVKSTGQGRGKKDCVSLPISCQNFNLFSLPPSFPLSLPPSRCLRANNGCTSSENNHLSSVTPPPPAAVAALYPPPSLSPSPLTPRALFCHRVFFALALPAKGVCQMLQIRDTDGDILEFIENDDARVASSCLFWTASV